MQRWEFSLKTMGVESLAVIQIRSLSKQLQNDLFLIKIRSKGNYNFGMAFLLQVDTEVSGETFSCFIMSLPYAPPLIIIYIVNLCEMRNRRVYIKEPTALFQILTQMLIVKRSLICNCCLQCSGNLGAQKSKSRKKPQCRFRYCKLKLLCVNFGYTDVYSVKNYCILGMFFVFKFKKTLSIQANMIDKKRTVSVAGSHIILTQQGPMSILTLGGFQQGIWIIHILYASGLSNYRSAVALFKYLA